MASNVNDDLPEGFVLQGQEEGDDLPSGFVLQGAEEPGMLSKIGDDLSKRNANINELVGSNQEGKINTPVGILGTAGQLAGGAMDVAGQVVKPAIDASIANMKGMGMLPQGVGNNLEEVTKQFLNTQPGQAVLQAFKGGSDLWNSFKEKNPNIATSIEGMANIGMAGAQLPTAGKAVSMAGDIMGKTASAPIKTVIPSIDETVLPIAKKAIDLNIPISRIQLSDSKAAKTASSALNKLPLTGAQKFQNAQQEAFNREVLSTIGVNANKSTPASLSNAYSNIGKKFDAALKGQQISISDDFINSLANIETTSKEALIPDVHNIVKKQVDKVLGSIDKDGTVAGEKLGNLRSQLTKLTKGQGSEKPYIAEIRNLVRDESVKGAPQRKEILQEAIDQYRNYKVIQPLLKKAVRGDISTSQLLGRITQNYPDFERGGGGKLGDLARIGQAFLKDPIPDSGTAQRQLWYNALGLGGSGAYSAGSALAGLKLVGAPIVAGKGLNLLNNSQPLVKKAILKNLAKSKVKPKDISALSALSVPTYAAAKNALNQLNEQQE